MGSAGDSTKESSLTSKAFNVLGVVGISVEEISSFELFIASCTKMCFELLDKSIWITFAFERPWDGRRRQSILRLYHYIRSHLLQEQYILPMGD
jgi:hypothetical protein